MLFNTRLRVQSYQCLNIYPFSRKDVYFIILYTLKIQVLHGCLQSVFWEGRLIPPTGEIPFVNLNKNLTFNVLG